MGKVLTTKNAAPAKKSQPGAPARSASIAKSKATKPVVSKSAPTKPPSAKPRGLAKLNATQPVGSKGFAITPKVEDGKKVRKKQRPSVTLTLDLMETICDRIADGEATYRVLQSPGMPDDGGFFRQMRQREDLAALYREAVDRRGEKFADEITELCDQARHGTHEEIQALKLMVNTRQWIVSRLLPKKYGDKVVLAGDNANPLTMQMVSNATDLIKRIKGTDDE